MRRTGGGSEAKGCVFVWHTGEAVPASIGLQRADRASRRCAPQLDALPRAAGELSGSGSRCVYERPVRPQKVAQWERETVYTWKFGPWRSLASALAWGARG